MTETVKNALRLGFVSAGILLMSLFVSLATTQTVHAAITNQLDIGSTGSDVSQLQQFLATNILIYPAGTVSGFYGPLTQAAVVQFQAAYNIPQVGRVGLQTMAKMNDIMLSGFAPGTAIPIVGYVPTPAGMNDTAGGQALQDPQQASSGLPFRLSIPKIDVDAAIEYVGLTPQGIMDVTEGPTNVAWFALGPRAGDNGSAVIAGHDEWKDGIPAVFDDLYKLQKGDKIYVEDEQGATIAFVVREIRIYGKNEDATDVFGSSDGKAHLNLITCEGIWDKAQKSYSNRLIVFADKESTLQ